MISEVFKLIIACVAIWLSTGLILETVKLLSPTFKLSKVTLSLLVLGVVSSFPEIAVTINSIALNSPQIAIGNLIGSQVFLLFVVIPVLAIVSQGLDMRLQLKNVSLSLALLLALIPILALYDQQLNILESSVILVLYAVFAVLFTQKSNMVERVAQNLEQLSSEHILWQVTKLLVCVAILLLASNSAVRGIIEIAALLETPRFLLSMILLPIVTNLPELSLALGTLSVAKKSNVLGDYLGALTFNSLLLAVLSLAVGGAVMIGQDISAVVILFALGIIVFWIFSFSKYSLSSKEGLLFLFFYVLVMIAAGWQIMSAFN
jgi:cation:H+ antiporter